MAIVGVVGLSGSGKSTLIDEYKARGFQVFDDIGCDPQWSVHAQRIRQAAQNGDVVVSDILFCCRTPQDACQVIDSLGCDASHPIRQFRGRDDFERQLGEPIEWVFFENDPSQCSKNCGYRATQIQRNLGFENALIQTLTHVYEPPKEALLVWTGVQSDSD